MSGNLWMHFTRMSAYAHEPVPTIARGEGAYIYDTDGRRYLDGLSGLFVVQAGHGREELAEAAAKQARELAFFPIWSYAHPKALELSERLASLTSADARTGPRWYCCTGSVAIVFIGPDSRRC